MYSYCTQEQNFFLKLCVPARTDDTSRRGVHSPQQQKMCDLCLYARIRRAVKVLLHYIHNWLFITNIFISNVRDCLIPLTSHLLTGTHGLRRLSLYVVIPQPYRQSTINTTLPTYSFKVDFYITICSLLSSPS